MAKVSTGLITYLVDEKTLLVSSALANKRMTDLLNRTVQTELLDYSPAMGSKVLFAAMVVANIVKGKVALVDQPSSEKGVVY